jgi:hypothetical protein
MTFLTVDGLAHSAINQMGLVSAYSDKVAVAVSAKIYWWGIVGVIAMTGIAVHVINIHIAINMTSRINKVLPIVYVSMAEFTCSL